MELQKVSIVIANLNGKHHLRDCFASIQRLNYPKDKIEVILVDNGSTDGSVEFVKNHYDWVKLICNSKNEGFAKPSNDGARAATGKYVAFLNNDMRVHPDWLIELIKSLDNNNAQCAGSVILNWNGKLLDFAGGGVNFYGLGYQDDFARPMSEMEPLLKQDKELLFACGGAMIVERDKFLFAGGFDEDYFAYYEDADLGWRLNVLGCKVVLSVKSRVFHKHNSTSKTIARERIQYLFERNKLYSCYKNYSEELLNKIFFPSLLLQVRELYLESGIDGFNYNIKNPGVFDSDPVTITHKAAMMISALNEFTENIAKMTEKRSFIQKNRKKSDDEISKLVDKPFIVFPHYTGEYLSSEYDIIKAFNIDVLLNHPVKTNVVIITGEKNGDDGMTGSRCREFAKALSSFENFRITVACPNGCESGYENVISYGDDDFGALTQAVKESVAVVLMGTYPISISNLKNEISKKYVLTDIGSLSHTDSGKFSAGSFDKDLKEIINLTDYYICANNNQKDYILGVLTALKALPNTKSARDGEGVVEVVDSLVSAGAVDRVADFIKFPRHSEIRKNHGCESFESAEAPFHGSLRDHLALIEKRQADIERLLMSDRRLIKEMHTSVKEIKNWSLLMDSRFFKLKAKLLSIRFLRRFVK